MACFIVPAAEAVVTAIAAKAIRKKENTNVSAETEINEESGKIQKIKFSRKLRWLTNLLWGGSALLAFEHIWHGEVVPWFPFLTAVENPESAAEMLREMASTGGIYGASCYRCVGYYAVCGTFLGEERKFRTRICRQ